MLLDRHVTARQTTYYYDYEAPLYPLKVYDQDGVSVIAELWTIKCLGDGANDTPRGIVEVKDIDEKKVDSLDWSSTGKTSLPN